MIFLFVYGGAFFCLWYVPINFYIQGIVSIVLIISCIINAKRYLFLSIIIRCHQKNWYFQSHVGHDFSALVLPSSVVTRYLIILNCRTVSTAKRFTLLLLPDSLSANELRQLRTQLL